MRPLDGIVCRCCGTPWRMTWGDGDNGLGCEICRPALKNAILPEEGKQDIDLVNDQALRLCKLQLDELEMALRKKKHGLPHSETRKATTELGRLVATLGAETRKLRESQFKAIANATPEQRGQLCAQAFSELPPHVQRETLEKMVKGLDNAPPDALFLDEPSDG